MTDLRAFTRDPAVQMESDLGTMLDRVAIAHWNTDNPHVHLLVRGVADDGSDLIISRDYISHGLRSRAETWFRPSAPSPSMRSTLLSRARWKQSAGLASTRRSGGTPSRRRPTAEA
jgi:type IV secretory pathway VirD2 relaxase